MLTGHRYGHAVRTQLALRFGLLRETGPARRNHVPAVAQHEIGSLPGAILQKFFGDDHQTMWQLGYVWSIFRPFGGRGVPTVTGAADRIMGVLWDRRGSSAFARLNI
jgi:hypothetical protein